MGRWRSASCSKITLHFPVYHRVSSAGQCFYFHWVRFSFQENGHEDGCSSLAGRKMFWIMPQSPREIISSTPEVPKGKRMGLSLGEMGCHGDRSLDNWGWRAGWAQRCPEAESWGNEWRRREGSLALLALLHCQEIHSPVLVTEGGGPKPQDLMAHA